MSGAPLLAVERLRKHYLSPKVWFGPARPPIQAVDDISFTVERGETLALVGESGCGKTTTAKSVVRLVEPTSGSIRLEGEELTTLSAERMRQRRKDLQIVFQDPYASLDPRLAAGEIVAEPLRNFAGMTGAERKDRVQWLFARVGLRPESAAKYPHEFSGGQRQRIGIARALALNPKLIICDEPVSALDVSVQAQVVNLLQELQEEFGLTYLFISHGLAVVEHISDRVAVMYLGKIVEICDAAELYQDPLMPYTQALLSAIPVPDPTRKRERIVLTGDVPTPINPPSGCRFRTRCPYAIEECAERVPELREIKPDHFAACIRIPGYDTAPLYEKSETTVAAAA